MRALIYAVESGDLGGYLREAEWNGFRQGASGASDDGPLVDAVALRWAVGAVVGPGLAGQPPRDVRALHRSLDRLVVRVVSGLADGLRARNEATHVEH